MSLRKVLSRYFLIDLFKGLRVTFKQQAPGEIITEQYPRVRPVVGERFRGAPRLNIDPDTGESGRAQDLFDVVRIAQRQRAGRAGRLRCRRPEPLDPDLERQREPRIGLERCPGGKRQTAARAQRAGQVAKRADGIVEEHHAEARDREIMAAALEPVGLGVGAHEVDVAIRVTHDRVVADPFGRLVAGAAEAGVDLQDLAGIEAGVLLLRLHEVLLDVLLAETRRVIPGATWTAAGIGREQMRVMEWALVRGADAIRTGMEDNIRVSKDRLTTGNAELVGLAVEVIGRHCRRPATPVEARAILNLTPV